MSRPDLRILVQGTADWNQPIATNQHYMVRELAEAFDVTFVESLGLRRPELSRKDIGRAARRVFRRHDASVARTVPERVNIVSPRIVPIHTGLWEPLNRRALDRQLANWRTFSGTKVYWTYSPVTYGFERDAELSVYHCVDLYREFPGISPRVIDEAEQRLAATGIVAIGSSEVVVEHLRTQGFRDVIYWPNVADTAEIERVYARAGGSVRHGAVFAGNLSDKKVDFALLHALVASGIELHLAGPIAEGGGSTQASVDRLIEAGATYHGVLTLAELSEVMLQCRVGLIPYLLNPYTKGVSPLKTYEYLAAGLAVVSTMLPGVLTQPPHVVVAGDAAEFTDEVVRLCTVGEAGSFDGDTSVGTAPVGDMPVNGAPVSDALAERTRIARAHSWTTRGAQARALIEPARGAA